MIGLWGTAAAMALFAAWWLASRPAAGRWKGVAGSTAPTPAALRGSRSEPLAPSVSGTLDAALALELVAAMLNGGSSLARALRIAARVSRSDTGPMGRAAAALELGVSWEQAWPQESMGRDAAEIRRALTFAAVTGAPSAGLISARARMLRRKRHRELERRAAALGVRLVVPLGACSLPAFLCLGVVPVLISMMPG